MMFTNPLDWLSIPGFAVGVIGLVIAVYQTRSMQKVRQVSQKKNTERCKNVFSIVTSLAKDASDACEIVNSDCKYKRGPECSTLTAKVNSTVTLTSQLATFCNTLNEEHKEEFGDFVDDQLEEKLNEIICLSQRV